MAARAPNDDPHRPEVGDTLIVIHDFIARSSDELSLGKGDRVELIERDDEFGDGWYLGRHLVNGNTGLFPQVYTRPAPRNVPTITSPSKLPTPHIESLAERQIISPSFPSPQVSEPSPTPPPPPPPLAAAHHQASTPISLHSTSETATPSIHSETSSLTRLHSASQDSQVLNDTLNVINEHITDLRSPASTTSVLRTHNNDSGSEYSVPLEHRMSYIQGEETDEEEDGSRSRAEVEAWSPDEVAENLFAAGVEQPHCDVFRDQEISGEVLLGMDQSSLFIKAFDLGSVGRRLKTWHKIKAIQEEVINHDAGTRRTTRTYGSDVGSEKTRSRNNTLTNIPGAIQPRNLSGSQAPKSSPTARGGMPSTNESQDSLSRPNHVKRPSAASVRELHHSRRYSATEFRAAPPTPGSSTTPSMPPGTAGGAGGVGGVDGGHKKQPSFDRSWTLGSAFSPPPHSPQLTRPLSSTGLHDMLASEKELQDSAVDLERGYFSGTELDGRKRNVLRKRDSATTSHSRTSSYAEEQRIRAATALSRHSRFGSVDSYRDGPPSAAQKYYGIQPSSHRRTASTNTTDSVRPLPPLKDTPPPSVTRLDTGATRRPKSPNSRSFHADWLSSVVSKATNKDRSPGLRSSDKTGLDRSRYAYGSAEPSPKTFSMDSPAATTASSLSAAPSFEFDSSETAQSPSVSTTPGSKAGNRRKGKKDTSAYTRGLQKVGPREAQQGADYSGWMKKKNSHLMTTWKPRFFVLKGRRLAYYYSENDTEEKGLIDISFHRVLPADNEKLTGLHATISNAVGGPSIPNSALSPTSETSGGKNNDSVFIFKLVPPRAGLSRAVTFTKPMVHYFAVPNVTQGRLWMAALMKATIDRDDSQPITTTYQQKTISLTKAKQMRHRPPALMNLDETIDEHSQQDDTSAPANPNSLGIFGEGDSGVAGIEKALVSSPGQSSSTSSILVAGQAAGSVQHGA